MSRPLSPEEVNQAFLYLKNLPFKQLENYFEQLVNGFKVLKQFPQFDEPINLNFMILKEMERREKTHKKEMDNKALAEREARLKAWRQEVNEVQKARDSNPNWGAFQ